MFAMDSSKRKREQSPNKQTKRPKLQRPPNWNNNDEWMTAKSDTDCKFPGEPEVMVMYNKRRPSEECPELAYLLLQRTPLVPRIFNNERVTTISEVVPTNNELIEICLIKDEGQLNDNEAESGFCHRLLQRTPSVERSIDNERVMTISEVVRTNVCLSSSAILSPEVPTNLEENNWNEEIGLNELIETYLNGDKGPLSDNEAESGFCFD
ncbi:hypothetical protein CHUAL_010641 [Chamberlinius hualienensis]